MRFGVLLHGSKEEEALSSHQLSHWHTSLEQEQTEEAPAITPAEQTPPLTREQLRLQRIEEPLAPIAGSVEQARKLLRDFEGLLPSLRRQLTARQGRFEVFYVPKRRFKQEVIAYAKALRKAQKHHTTVPAEIELAVHPEVRHLIQAHSDTFPRELREHVYDIIKVGPYVKYRWLEGKHTYCISLGLLDDYPPFPFTPEGF